MADKKISELTAITGSNTAATDVFVVVDTSTGQTKKITREELNNAIEQDVLSSIDIDTINGDFSVNGNINLGDNNKAIFGAGSDLEIYHDGSNSYVHDAGTGGLYLRGSSEIALRSASNENIFLGLTDGSAYVYHNGSVKLSTTSTGVDVTGALTVSGDFTVNGTTTTINSTTLEVDDKNIVLASGAADAAAANGSGITIDGASATFTYVSTGDKWQLNKPLDVGGNVTFGDNEKAVFGAGSDLQIYHDGSNSYVQDAGTGNLFIQSNGTSIRLRASDGTQMLRAEPADGSVRLYHGGSQKLLTTSTGIAVTGNATFGDNGKAIFGAGTDLQIYHDGSNSAIQNATGELFVYGGGEQIRIRAENSEESIVINPNGSVNLYHNGSSKLATNSAGVQTNVLSANGLKVGGNGTDIDSTVSGANSVMSFRINGSEKMRLDSSGNFGIGTTSPTELLSLYKYQSDVAIRMQGSNASYFIENNYSEDALTFTRNATEVFRLDSSGNVGIGTSSPAAQFETNSSGFGHRIEGVSVSNYSIHRFVTDTSDTDKFVIGYGASHPSAPHQIALKAGNAAGTVGLYTAGAEGARLLSNRDFHVDGNVVAYSTTISDIRLKKDIAPIEDAVTKVQQLNGCTFTYLKDDRKSAGLIAQDVEKVLPSAVIEDEAVFHGEEGETYKTVQYDQVIGLLVEAVKELKAEIEELKNGTAK